MNNSQQTNTTANEVVDNCCVICGNKHNFLDCDFIKITKHVPDNKIPSKAKLTMPSFLEIQNLSDGSYSVITRLAIDKGTQFGPLLAEMAESLNGFVSFPLKMFPYDENHNNEFYLDLSDENKCSWLIFIRPAENSDEQNLICYQDKNRIYYVAIKNIEVGETLKVWYSPYYASRMNKSVLNSEAEVEHLKSIDISALIKKQQKIMERKIWTCKFCSQVESDIVLFAKHILKHYAAQLNRVCEICKTTFNSKKSLKNHLSIVHKPIMMTSQSKPSKNLKSISKSSIQDVGLGGPLLNDIFTDSSDLQQSDLNQFELNVDNHNLLLDNDNLTVDNLLNENVKDLDHFNFEIDDSQKQFVCDICLKQFTKVKLLIIHLKHHTGEFICFKCLKIFCRKENLDAHACNGTPQYVCSLCEKSFTQRKYLSRHFEAMHNKKFKCVTCKKSYLAKKDLLEHNCSKIPISEKETFMCPYCSKQFFRNKYLKKHLKIHGPKIKNAKSSFAVCDVCGLSLKSKNSYYLHRKKHSQPSYECEICSKKFYRQDTLNDHIQSHQSTAEFQCDICQKKFKTLRILKSHKKFHETKKIVECPICGMQYKQRTTLNRHLNTIHRKNKNVRTEFYSCPICNKTIKLRSSLLRHLRKIHNSTNNQIDVSSLKPETYTNEVRNEKIGKINIPTNNEIENIVFKEINTTNNERLSDLASKNLQNELDDHIKNLLNSRENNSAIHNQAIDSLVKELHIDEVKEHKEAREVCLSIPDLTETDQEITLDKNAYILENGTIVQPQGNSDNVIIYVLDQSFA